MQPLPQSPVDLLRIRQGINFRDGIRDYERLVSELQELGVEAKIENEEDQPHPLVIVTIGEEQSQFLDAAARHLAETLYQGLALTCVYSAFPEHGGREYHFY